MDITPEMISALSPLITGVLFVGLAWGWRRFRAVLNENRDATISAVDGMRSDVAELKNDFRALGVEIRQHQAEDDVRFHSQGERLATVEGKNHVLETMLTTLLTRGSYDKADS